MLYKNQRGHGACYENMENGNIIQGQPVLSVVDLWVQVLRVFYKVLI